jgi:hypothetical protein
MGARGAGPDGRFRHVLETLRAYGEQRVEPGGDGWCAVQSWLGWAAVSSSDLAAALDYFTAVRDAAAGQGSSRLLADALAGRSVTLLNVGRLAGRPRTLAGRWRWPGDLSYPAGEAEALGRLAIAAF